MAKVKIRIYRNESEEIKIELDSGLLINDWRDLSASDCLTMGYGGFKINGATLILGNEAADKIVLDGNPFEGAISGSAEVSFTKTSCNGNGWEWEN